MTRHSATQLTLGLFDSTALTGGLGLPLGGSVPCFRDEDDEPAVVPETVRVPATNFHLAGDRGLAHGWKARAADNIAAVRLLHELEQDERAATRDEQAQLAKFTGFGASELANALFPVPGQDVRPGWEQISRDLNAATSDAERAGLMRATQYAHYTPEYLVRAMWAALTGMGFAGGHVLEPGCGTGLFLALMPEKAAAKASITAIEMDPITARIAGKLFPEAWVRAEDFTKARIAERFELAIGNPPFSDRTVRGEDSAGKLGLSLHDYFIARSIERLKPGGIGAFVTSRWTMDKTSSVAREHIAEMADLVGAVRLPQAAMLADAGTEVVVDVLVFRKRLAGEASRGTDWLDVREVPDSDEGEGLLSVNSYFLDHPEMVLGRHAWTSSQFGPTYTCRGTEGLDLPAALARALQVATSGIRFPLPEAVTAERAKSPRIIPGTVADGATIREGSYLLLGSELHQVVDGVPTPVPVKSSTNKEGLFDKHARIIRALIPIRDAVRAVLRAQEANEPWGAHQTRLRAVYHQFARQFGPINRTITTIREVEVKPMRRRKTAEGVETGEAGVDCAGEDEAVQAADEADRLDQDAESEAETISAPPVFREQETQRRPNLQPFMDDPDVWLVSSIEEYDEETDTGRPGPVFNERVIHPPVEPLITSAADALAVALHETGVVDLARIGELLGRSRQDVLAELGEAVFLDPELTTEEHEAWITADAALSGAVRTKLARTEAAAALDARYARNVAALRLVQPEDLRPSDITARLGAPWIPTEFIEAFTAEVIGVTSRVMHCAEVACWTINKHAFAGQAAATSTWGTSRRHAGELMDDALNSVMPQIYDVWRDENGEHRQLNAQETEAAKEKLAKIKRAFETWIWSDSDRADRLVRLYNDGFNNMVPRRFDGSHLQLPGASSAVVLRAHQKRATWRIIAAGSTYLAHAVGAGKTFTLCAAIMEQKRLGLITKPMMVVPGHCLAQASREFLQLYPMARILVADESNFVKAKRQRFLARAATGNWDCIVITHDAFKFIPVLAEFERGMIREQIGSYVELLARIDTSDRISRKRVERMKEGMEEKLEALKGRKDDLLCMGEIGIDQVLVDEAQQFRKLSFATNQSGLKGIDPNGSQRAWDLYVKTAFLRQSQPMRPLVLASGTPITNTLGEMFSLQRVMQPDVLRSRAIHEFDAWAATFGDARTELELQPSGLYKPVTRFAEFVNVADLMAMYRSFADVVLKDELRQHVRLPAIASGKRQIVAAPASKAFKAYQKVLAARIKTIEQRKGPPQKGQDILLSVITDGRHAAIDLRFVRSDAANDDGNKLNALIANAHRLYTETSGRSYTDPRTGQPHPVRGGAQMIFSDLGTQAAMRTRGFSAYAWIRSELIRLGVPAAEIAFMQDYKKSAAKQRLFQSVNEGRVRFLLGSTQTMGTGVNAQQRLVALHHLDVPWLVADIEQREGRIERQGNQNEEIGLYAYALQGSVDATNWQLLERKIRFIALAMSGDRSIRRLEDVGSDANQFAMAKALASGDARLMQKAGLEAEIARLDRQRAAHFDDQQAVRRQIANARHEIGAAQRALEQVETDLARRVSTRADNFTMTLGDQIVVERKNAGASILSQVRTAMVDQQAGERLLGLIGGFELVMEVKRYGKTTHNGSVRLELTGRDVEFGIGDEVGPLGLIARLENALDGLEREKLDQQRTLKAAEQRLPAYEQRLGGDFELADELEGKLAELAELEAALAATTTANNEDDGNSSPEESEAA